AGGRPVPIDGGTRWGRDFRGLWGLDTRDRFGGERAPAGPRYERDGSVRGAWANPAGWAGLLKIAPGSEDVARLLAERVTELEGEMSELDAIIVSERHELRRLRAEACSLDAHVPAEALAA